MNYARKHLQDFSPQHVLHSDNQVFSRFDVGPLQSIRYVKTGRNPITTEEVGMIMRAENGNFTPDRGVIHHILLIIIFLCFILYL